MKKILFTLVVSSIAISISYGQKKVEKAFVLAREAAILIEKNDFKSAEKLLKKAVKLDPENKQYAYDLCYSYYKIGNFKKAVELTEIFMTNNEFDDTRNFINDLFTQAGVEMKYKLKPPPKKEPVTAKEFKEEALQLMTTDTEKAILYFEKAIDLEPEDQDNYYYAAKLYANTNEQMWALLYAEAYILLAPQGNYCAEMKQLMLNAYKKAIIIKSPGTYQLAFTQRKAEYGLENFDPKNFKVNFEQSFTTTFELCTDRLDNGGFRISNLYFMRKGFIEYWFRGKEYEYPCFLFDIHKKMMKENVFEGYHYWLFKDIFPDEYNEWNKYFFKQYSQFETWLNANKTVITSANKMNSMHYRELLKGLK